MKVANHGTGLQYCRADANPHLTPPLSVRRLAAPFYAKKLSMAIHRGEAGCISAGTTLTSARGDWRPRTMSCRRTLVFCRLYRCFESTVVAVGYKRVSPDAHWMLQFCTP
ncbi:unnamed protein product [Symbiodinium natans]|uniref:Uncharacterized protein n=1 Tax=Symbiodinium natans TaxID=878477 RepID=A0A812IF51_9DINO|nr:unnamed protein product [Symbiodinium natans]